jgi:pimeloyl-ACP methyl ester carboxylesterase
MYRIPNPGKPIVLFQHGVEESSMAFVINDADKSPGFMLAKAGYDVWFGNNRGNEYSEGHTSLSTNDEKYWDFDFEEMGLHDLPAEFEYILNNTGRDKIDTYIGHSEGTT